MAAIVAKWGKSLAVRIPLVIDGTLVVKPRSRKRYALYELIKGITPGNLHAEIDSGIAVGKEVW